MRCLRLVPDAVRKKTTVSGWEKETIPEPWYVASAPQSKPIASSFANQSVAFAMLQPA